MSKNEQKALKSTQTHNNLTGFEKTITLVIEYISS